MKTLSKIFKQDKEKFVVPKGVQDAISAVQKKLTEGNDWGELPTEQYEKYANIIFTEPIYEALKVVHEYLATLGIETIGRFGK